MKNVKDFYEASYRRDGRFAQRRYPNEELCRYIGRNFKQTSERKGILILEVGCGSCSNVWMLAKEGFNVYGCDISEESIMIGTEILHDWGVTANLTVSDMLKTPYKECFFDVVVDVFSSYCLNRTDYIVFLTEMYRILKPSGKLFSYFPSKHSDTFIRSTIEDHIDIDTLQGIKDEKSPYYGNNYPFRFMSDEDVNNLLPTAGFSLQYLERTGRSYHRNTEYFEWLVFEAIRKI
jgi:ubiquinone/menaquinone biosynthesis C-methylase UbiE